MGRPRGPQQRFGGRAVGSVMALGAGTFWSFGAVTTRLAAHTNAFQYLAWRSIGIIAVIEGWRALTGRSSHLRAAFTSGPRMHLANLSLLLASLGFVYAIKSTSVATAAFLGSTTPFFGVLAGRVFLRERIEPRTVGAIALAFGGLLVMLVGDAEAGSVIGLAAALSAAVGFAAYTTLVRSAPDRDWSPVLPGYGTMMVVICGIVVVAGGDALVPPAGDIGWAMLHGGLFIVAGTLLYNGASRNVAAAAMTVYAQSEMVLVPVWAFLVLAERPEGTTVAGGTLILVAVVGKAVLDHRSESAAPVPPGPGEEPVPVPA